MTASAVLAVTALALVSSCAGTESAESLPESSNLPRREIPGDATPTPSPGKEDVDIRELVERQFADSVAVFERWDGDFQTPEMLTLDKDAPSQVLSDCASPVDGNAFYCPLDNTISFDLGWLEEYSRRSVSTNLRDGAVFSTVAHELGHAWEEHKAYRDNDPSIVNNELFADCIAGAVIAAVYAEPEVSAPLIHEAAEDAYSTGSYDWENPDFHGTPAQRWDATMVGARSGRIACEAYLR